MLQFAPGGCISMMVILAIVLAYVLAAAAAAWAVKYRIDKGVNGW